MKHAIAAVVLAAALTMAGPAAAGKKSGGTVTTTYSCSDGVFSWSFVVTTLSGIFTGGNTSAANC